MFYLKKDETKEDGYAPVIALDRSFIDKFDLYLKTECGFAPGTVVFLTTRLNTIIGHAMTEGIINADPFAGYEPQRPGRQQKYLIRKELDKLMTTPLPRPKHYLIRNLFLFSCYTGIPYCSICANFRRNISRLPGTAWSG